MNGPRVLIEDWFPIDKIGAECMRERGASSALPPLYFLHVWWARRPLTISRAAILASVLPAWDERFPKELRKQFPTQEAYHDWFLKLIGILGDPAETRRRIQAAKRKKVDLGPDPYGYKRAFTYSPNPQEMETARALLKHAWGTDDLTVLDPMAGGGSIPFESLRFGFHTIANDMNPVASLILKATLDYPRRFGPDLAQDIRKFGAIWAKRVRERLEPFFPIGTDENVFAYLWARTVSCPRTSKPVPLSPNWWLVQGEEPMAVRVVAEPQMKECQFEVVRGRKACDALQPEIGTVKRAVGKSPWGTKDTIEGDYIKAEAQAGRMGQQLYAVALKRKGGFEFRAPTDREREAVEAAEKALAKSEPAWASSNLLPDEEVPFGHRTERDGFDKYGVTHWRDFFSPRQLLAMGTSVDELRRMESEVRRTMDAARAEAILIYLALSLDKAADRNSRFTRWIPQRQVIANTFDRHDFAFGWSFAEFDGARNMLPWAVEQVVDSYRGIASLSVPGDGLFSVTRTNATRLGLTKGSAATLREVESGSVSLVCVDPPYYDNVMYAELADFFYVWEKRTAASLLPAIFAERLTNKDDEAVANPARFRGQGAAKDKADEDYHQKMASCFREMARALSERGLLQIMFTNKKVRAWDALASGLIKAGFVIETSWPVPTEFEHGLNVARKNSARSTLLLLCRKRAPSRGTRWWDAEFQSRVSAVAREKAMQFESLGITGVDLYLSTFGPVLAEISSAWPVLDPQGGEPIRPEAALDLARKAVTEYRFESLAKSYKVDLDPVTRWYVLAWDLFRAAEFPYDEGRKLGLAVSGEVATTTKKGEKRQKDFLEGVIKTSAGVAAKKGEYLHLATPAERHRDGRFDLDGERFEHLLDALHAAIVLLEQDGLKGVKRFFEKNGLARDRRFLGAFEALLFALPQVRPEWKALDEIREGLLEAKVKAPPKQTEIEFEGGAASADGGDEEEDGEDDGDD